MALRPITVPVSARRRATRIAGYGIRRLLPPPELSRRRAVLCYHSVNPSPSPLSLSPALLDEHLAWLREHAHVMGLEELVAGPVGNDGPYVAITFDDGYEDNLVHALPRLAASHLTATFFVVAGFLARDDEVMAHLSRVWHTPVKRLRPLSWEGLAELHGAGMSIGSHTWSHRNLARLPLADVTSDLARARETLEERLGQPVRAVAYPWGKLGRHVTRETLLAAGRAGYELGVISLPRAARESDGPLRVARFGVGDEPVESLAAKVGGSIDWHAYLHERIPAPVARRLFDDHA